MPLPNKPVNTQPSASERSSVFVKQSLHRYARQSVFMLNKQIDNIFGVNEGETETSIVSANLAALGTEAENFFLALNEIRLHLVSLLAGTQYESEITAVTARIGNLPAYTVNPDGSATLD